MSIYFTFWLCVLTDVTVCSAVVIRADTPIFINPIYTCCIILTWIAFTIINV